jgi:hypothetical protein
MSIRLSSLDGEKLNTNRLPYLCDEVKLLACLSSLVELTSPNQHHGIGMGATVVRKHKKL